MDLFAKCIELTHLKDVGSLLNRRHGLLDLWVYAIVDIVLEVGERAGIMVIKVDIVLHGIQVSNLSLQIADKNGAISLNSKLAGISHHLIVDITKEHCKARCGLKQNVLVEVEWDTLEADSDSDNRMSKTTITIRELRPGL